MSTIRQRLAKRFAGPRKRGTAYVWLAVEVRADGLSRISVEHCPTMESRKAFEELKDALEAFREDCIARRVASIRTDRRGAA